MKKAFRWVMVMVAAVAVFLYFWGGRELTEQEKQAVDKAYTACAHKVDEAANELEKWYMRYSDGPTEEAAEELLGSESKWKMNASEEECEEYARSVVLKHLPEGVDNELTEMIWWAPQVKNVWEVEEKKLAGETNCPDLCEKVKVRNAKGERATNAFDDKTLYKNLRKEMFKAFQRLKDIEPYKTAVSWVAGGLGAVAGGAVGGSVGGVAGGPVGGTVGGSVGGTVGNDVGKLVGSKGVDWIANPAGGIQKILDDRVRKMAQERKKKFCDTMMKELDARRKEWERHIRWER